MTVQAKISHVAFGMNAGDNIIGHWGLLLVSYSTLLCLYVHEKVSLKMVYDIIKSAPRLADEDEKMRGLSTNYELSKFVSEEYQAMRLSGVGEEAMSYIFSNMRCGDFRAGKFFEETAVAAIKKANDEIEFYERSLSPEEREALHALKNYEFQEHVKKAVPGAGNMLEIDSFFMGTYLKLNNDIRELIEIHAISVINELLGDPLLYPPSADQPKMTMRAKFSMELDFLADRLKQFALPTEEK